MFILIDINNFPKYIWGLVFSYGLNLPINKWFRYLSKLILGNIFDINWFLFFTYRLKLLTKHRHFKENY